MNYSPYQEGGGIPRRYIVIAVVVLAVAALVMLVGPSNVLQLLHLKDLETTPAVNPVPVNPQSAPIITPEELRPYVVGNKHPNPVQLADYAHVASNLQVNAVIVPVKGGFELEFLIDSGGVISATLIESATGSRLSVTTGTTGPLYDTFTHLDEQNSETQTDAVFIPPRPIAD